MLPWVARGRQRRAGQGDKMCGNHDPALPPLLRVGRVCGIAAVVVWAGQSAAEATDSTGCGSSSPFETSGGSGRHAAVFPCQGARDFSAWWSRREPFLPNGPRDVPRRSTGFKLANDDQNTRAIQQYLPARESKERMR